MIVIIKRTILIFIANLPLFLLGQQKTIPLRISVFNESTSIPFTKFFSTPIHPGIQAGTEYDYQVRGNSRMFQTISLSYFYHKYLAQGVGLNTAFGYEYRFKKGLAFAVLPGIGYMHTFATTKEYVFKDGQYHIKTDKGNPRLYPSLSIDSGYYLNKNNTLSPQLFIRYEIWAEYPYSPGFIPIMTHLNLHLGLKFFVNSQKVKK